jgi:hypothetical protein
MIYFLDKTDTEITGAPRHAYQKWSQNDPKKTFYVQADVDELHRAWDLLGVAPEHRPNKRVYTFVGEQALTIALNW